MINARNNSNWNKGYKMGNYVYEYGKYDAYKGSYPTVKDTLEPDEKAYWQAFFAKKYNGKF